MESLAMYKVYKTMVQSPAPIMYTYCFVYLSGRMSEFIFSMNVSINWNV
jgi:hypothetical protein